LKHPLPATGITREPNSGDEPCGGTTFRDVKNHAGQAAVLPRGVGAPAGGIRVGVIRSLTGRTGDPQVPNLVGWDPAQRGDLPAPPTVPHPTNPGTIRRTIG